MTWKDFKQLHSMSRTPRKIAQEWRTNFVLIVDANVTTTIKLKEKTEEKFSYKCKDCRLPFTVTFGTIFEKSTIPLDKWFIAIFNLQQAEKALVAMT